MADLKTITVILCVALVTAMCGKKAQEPATSALPGTVAQIKPATDVFDEFYVEEPAATAETAKAAQVKETFKTAPTASSAPRQQAKPALASTPVTAEFSTSGRYAVQVATVRSRTLADHTAAKLKERGYPAYVAEVVNPTPGLSGTFFRVRIGGFDAIASARAFAQSSLVPEGYEFWIDRRANDNVGSEGYGLGNPSGGYYGYTPAQPAQSAPAVSRPAQPQSSPAAGTSGESTWGKDDWGNVGGGW